MRGQRYIDLCQESSRAARRAGLDGTNDVKLLYVWRREPNTHFRRYQGALLRC
jgi:hypothetical protein